MRSTILFGLMAMTGLMAFGQNAQASCYHRHCGWGRSYHVSRCYAPVYRRAACYVPTCYTAPCVTTGYAPVSPVGSVPLASTAQCGCGNLPQCTQVYFTNR